MLLTIILPSVCDKKTDIQTTAVRFFLLKIREITPGIKPIKAAPADIIGFSAGLGEVIQLTASERTPAHAPTQGPKSNPERMTGMFSKVTRIAPNVR